MAAPNDKTETITGRVEAVNERGLKLNGTWRNLSKYHPVALPMRGALVALEVEGGRWIQRCDVLDVQDAHTAPDSHARQSNARERLIVRQCALKAAVQLAAARPDVPPSSDVLAVAEAFTRWILAEEGGPD